MPSTENTHEKVAAFIQEGQTEAAIDYLTEKLRNDPDRELYNDVSLLSGRYSNWEREFNRGVISDDNAVNVINVRLLEYAEKLDRRGTQPEPTPVVVDPIPSSPDPLEVVEPQARTPHPRPATPDGNGDQWTKYLVYAIGAVAVLALIFWFLKPDTPDNGGDNTDGGAQVAVIDQPGATTPPDSTTVTPIETGGQQPDHPVFRPGEPEFFYAAAAERNYVQPNLWEGIETREWYNDSLSTTITFNFSRRVLSASELLGKVELSGQLEDGYIYGTYAGASAIDPSGQLAFKRDDYVKERLNLFLLPEGAQSLTKFEFVPWTQ